MLKGHKSPQPLRDKLFSNSPDQLKSSILRESGMGWTSPPPDAKESPNNASITSPLRIAKRESPRSSTQLARRTSSSYRHVRNNNLVSKSPFKSQIPLPSTPTRPSSSRPSSVAFPPTRRVSGEKRPRPMSIQEQAETENERPFALKRERRQSKGFQNLLEKEPVSKSPFRLRQYGPSSQPPPLPASESELPVAPSSQSPEETGTTLRSRGPNAAPSPARSALVSRRLLGPRLSGSGRRERRKTVSFDERCDVLEFAPDEDEDEEVFESADDEMDGDGSDEQDEDGPFFQSRPMPADGVTDDDDSFEGIRLPDIETEGASPSLLHLDPDVSITGLVDEMFASNAAAEEHLVSTRYSTPPRTVAKRPDLETENGIPLGHSHHADRNLQHHHESPQPVPPHFSPTESPNPSAFRQPPSASDSPSDFPFSINVSPRASPLVQPSTPPRISPTSIATPPLGRSTHAERVKQAREEKTGQSTVDGDVEKLSVSPSPMKSLAHHLPGDIDIPVPHFDISQGDCMNEDPISLSPSGPGFFAREGDVSMHEEYKDDSLNLSIGNSEISLTGLSRGPETLVANREDSSPRGAAILTDEPLRSRSPHPTPMDGSRSSPLAGDHSRSPNAIPPRMSSPLFRAASPLSTSRHRSSSNSSLTGRQRITREDVQRRLLTRRSLGSPAPEMDAGSTSLTCSERAPSEPTENEEQSRMVDRGASPRGSVIEHPGNNGARQGQEAIDIVSHDLSFKVKPNSPREAKDLELRPPEAPATDLESSVPSKEVASDKLDGLGVPLKSSSNGMESISSRSSGHSSDTIVEASAPHILIEFKDTDMDMKSALDRLMDDVAGVGGPEGDDSIMTECKSYMPPPNVGSRPNRSPLARAMTEPTPLLHTPTGIGFSPDKDRSDSSMEVVPPMPPPKDNINHREQLILEKRREMRQLEAKFDEESEHSREYSCPPRPAIQSKTKNAEQQLLGVGRPSRRRSMSTGDAEILRKRTGEGLLDGVVSESNDALSDSIEKELKKFVEPKPKQQKAKYQVREREGTIYASSSGPDGVAHMSGPGDVNAGKAWRAVRRPSDMNEYSKLIKEYRAQEKSGKAYGKVFVKILGINNMHLPLPHQSTLLTCTLNNGIHFVTTPECQLGPKTRIGQEFELIEHSKLEFTLTLKVKRDPHIAAQFKALSPPPPPPFVPVVQAPSKGGMRGFFYSSPKKSSKDKIPAQVPLPPVHRLPENLARYMKPDGTLARVFVAFKDIAAHCDTRLFETSYPLIGQRLEPGGKFSTQQVGELVLQIFRLPPLPGIAPDQIPQSLDECCRGLRHLNWHKVTYFEGTLTQYGGGCMTWKRRRFRVIGANLVAFNDITKKATATIDLKKAVAVEDDQQGRGATMSPASGRSPRYDDDYLCGVERSFRLIFLNDEEIVFFADSDEDKAKWLEIFRALVGRIPPHPLWGELLWQRQEELTKRAQASPTTHANT